MPDTKLILDSLLADYRCRTDEIQKWIDRNQQLINFQLIFVIAVSTALWKLIDEHDIARLYWLLAIAPLIFLGLAWLSINPALLIVANGRYVNEVLREKINTLLQDEAMPNWEKFHWSVRRDSKLFYSIGNFGQGFFTMFISVVSLVVFSVVAIRNEQPPSVWQWSCFVFALTLWLLTGYLYIKMAIMFSKIDKGSSKSDAIDTA